MKIIYLDCQAGISGDMTVGALIDLGVPLEHLKAELAKLALPEGSYALSTSRTERHHLAALKFDVAVYDHHTHRDYAGIDSMIAGSVLSDPVKERVRGVFRRLAEAEAKVHGVPVEQVHFHEVGAVDSIVDIVATAVCLDYLGVEEIYASPMPLGSGFIETAHGQLPVPAPATAELLRGLPVHGGCGEGERVTPTGAAIVAVLARGLWKQPAMRLERVGCGAGSKDFPDCPNILRAFLGTAESNQEAGDEVIVAETNIDDSTPEVLGYVMERLLEEGALDCFFAPIQMKKNRPAVLLSFLCRPEQLAPLARLVLAETSAIGLRHYPAARITLERCSDEWETPYGPVRFKLIFENGHLLRAAPEYEDCRRIARERGIPCREVMERLAALGCSPGVMPAAGAVRERLNEFVPSAEVEQLDEELAALFREKGLTLALAESCTGGMIAQRITDVAGSSAYFLEGLVTYSNVAKERLLGVPAALLEERGAVSGEVAAAMAKGVRTVAGSDLGLAVTGIAGPDGGTDEKPVGTVFVSLAAPDGCRTERFQFAGSRGEIRSITTRTALDWLRSYLLI